MAPFVVIGGDAAGLSAASKLKREQPNRDVIVFEKGKWVSYAHCGMPYYVKGDVASITDLLSLSPSEIEDRGIDLRRKHEVVGIDPEEKRVIVEHKDNRFTQRYGELLIATGARARSEPLDGECLTGVFTMHSMDSAGAVRALLSPENEGIPPDLKSEYVDQELIEKYAAQSPPETVGIVGGGYVGVEMAEAFHAQSLDVHVFQRDSQLLPPFGTAVGNQVKETLESKDVTVHLDTEVSRLHGDGQVTALETPSEQYATDLVLLGIGIQPNTELIEETDITLGDSGAIATDDYGQTNIPDVYAAGDCAEMQHAVTGKPDWVPLGLTANRAGRAIGQTIAGTLTPVGSIAGTAVVKAFDLECGRTGILNHDHAVSAGFDPISETITAPSRSGYYPGSVDTTVSLTADRTTGKLLGGSIAGTDRAAIRIDTLATAIDQHMTVAELERLDLAYAPPFSPVWDPILVAAKVLNGQLSVA